MQKQWEEVFKVRELKSEKWAFFFFFFRIKLDTNICFHHSVTGLEGRGDSSWECSMRWETTLSVCSTSSHSAPSSSVQIIWTIATLTSVVPEDQNAQCPRRCSQFVKARHLQETPLYSMFPFTVFSFNFACEDLLLHFYAAYCPVF